MAVVVAVVVSVAFVASLVDAARHPARWAALFESDERWLRLLAWTVAVTLAAILGAWLAGASGEALGAIAVAGYAVGYVWMRLAGSSAMRRP